MRGTGGHLEAPRDSFFTYPEKKYGEEMAKRGG